MNAKQPVLSISILISGREEMRKCLESLRPILESLPCELILTDTGCNEEQLALAKEYTDIIIPFTWCNDFSVARNIGLKRATGDWFLYLDDDEWLEDPSEIISFFESGEYKKFNSAYYKVRNYVDHSGENYEDNFVMRMIKKEKESQFRGKVHEELYPLYAPAKILNAYVEHYGYAYASEEEKRKHAARNIPPLLEEIEENPDRLRWYGQLAQEYLVIGEYGKGVEIAVKGIKRYEAGIKSEEAPYYIYAALYCYAVLHYLRMLDVRGAEPFVEKGLRELKGAKPYRAYLLQSAVTVYEKVGRYRDCMNAAKEYLDIYNKIGKDKEAISREGFLITEGAFREVLRVPMLIRATLAAAQEKDYDKLEYFFFKLDWQVPEMSEQQEVEKCVIEVMLDVPYREVFSHIMKTMGERPEGMLELYPVLLKIERECKQTFKNEKLERLQNLVAKINSDHFYVLMSKIYCLDRLGDKNSITKVFHSIFAREENVLDTREDIWEIAKRYQIPLEPLFTGMDFVKWKHVLEKWLFIAPYEEAASWETRCGAWDCKNDIRCLLLKIRCSEIMIRIKGPEEDPEVLEKWLAAYAKEVLSYYRLFYKEEVFTTCPEVLPDEARFSLCYLDVEKAKKSGDMHSALKALREMLGIYPILEEVTLYYAKIVRDEADRQNKEAEDEKTELALLVRTLKNAAKMQIEKQEYQAAKEILIQIQNCMPGDKEVQELLKQTEVEIV